MNRKCILIVPFTLIAIVLSISLATGIAWSQDAGGRFHPSIPKTWVDTEIASLEIPLANPAGSPKHVTAEYYYRIPVRPIYRSYPRYRPGKEPPGYMEWLRGREPEIVFDPAGLKSEQDWIRAGEIVFHYPVDFSPDLPGAESEVIRRSGDLFDKDDISPFVNYVVRKKGVVEFGTASCADCHTRVMPDGSLLVGAQGNRPVDRIIGLGMRLAWERGSAKEREEALRSSRTMWHQELWTPWVRSGPQAEILNRSLLEMAGMHEAIPPGVLARQRSSILYPPAIPTLIGIKDIHYLDRSGLMRHRSIGDLMRYAALNQGADLLASYGGFIPLGNQFRKLPDPSTQERYSDEQLYALALYIYSLQPPDDPNRYSAAAERGREVFQRERCGMCHTPPLYTNNKLTPAVGFNIPEEHKSRYEILPIVVGTDPRLTMETRRGTGYYKVPSLRGVWYRSMFEHNGSVATLEDWFDPRRLRDDYVPTGFKGYGIKTRAVKGHEFGLKLSVEDKAALIAFLRTL